MTAPNFSSPVTDAMIDAACEARHTKRAWKRATADQEMVAWVTSHREQMRNILTAALGAGPAQDAVRAAAERVCWFDWSDNDMDAVAAIDALRKAITSSAPSTTQAVPRCEICDWPLAESAEKGCIPGDCSYRPDDPAEQRRIRERRQLVTSKQGNTP